MSGAFFLAFDIDSVITAYSESSQNNFRFFPGKIKRSRKVLFCNETVGHSILVHEE
jgi:hypothetical protein